jgi:hypothetical protein
VKREIAGLVAFAVLVFGASLIGSPALAACGKACKKLISTKFKACKSACPKGSARKPCKKACMAEKKADTVTCKAATDSTPPDCGETTTTTTTTSTTTTTTPSTTTTTMPCAGTVVGGFCWFMGAVGQSCDTVCTGAGLIYDDGGTRGFAGSGGTNAQCQSVLDALGASGTGAPSDLTCVDGYGCVTNTTAARVHCLLPATTATASNAIVHRMCACN